VSKKDTWIDPFIKKLCALDPPDDLANTKRAELAHLRRGLGKPTHLTLSRLGWLFISVPDWAVNPAVLIAGLFATHSQPHGSGSLGKALRRFRDATGAEESADKRFASLIDSDAEDLAERLRHIVKLLKSKNVPVDYAQLLKDILNWDHEERFVQWNWSRDYWRGLTDEPNETETSETSTPSTEGVAP